MMATVSQAAKSVPHRTEKVQVRDSSVTVWFVWLMRGQSSASFPFVGTTISAVDVEVGRSLDCAVVVDDDGVDDGEVGVDVAVISCWDCGVVLSEKANLVTAQDVMALPRQVYVSCVRRESADNSRGNYKPWKPR